MKEGGSSSCVCPSAAVRRPNLHALSPGKTEQAFLSPWTAHWWKTDLQITDTCVWVQRSIPQPQRERAPRSAQIVSSSVVWQSCCNSSKWAPQKLEGGERGVVRVWLRVFLIIWARGGGGGVCVMSCQISQLWQLQLIGPVFGDWLERSDWPTCRHEKCATRKTSEINKAALDLCRQGTSAGKLGLLLFSCLLELTSGWQMAPAASPLYMRCVLLLSCISS